MAKHDPNCPFFAEPPGRRDRGNCTCGYYEQPLLPQRYVELPVGWRFSVVGDTVAIDNKPAIDTANKKMREGEIEWRDIPSLQALIGPRDLIISIAQDLTPSG